MSAMPGKLLRCAIYTRKSTEHNLDLEFNALDAQREACEAYIKSQAHEGWRLVPDRYDDGGLSGASLDRPALQKLRLWRTGLWSMSNRSLARGNGNWNMASRDRRGKTACSDLKPCKFRARDCGVLA
jgi:hypothetical protein